jgi:penicillin amidase
MNLPRRDLLRRLGAGESIDSMCAAAGLTRADFDAWWQAECAARVPAPVGTRSAAVRRAVRVERDEWGIPHIFADNDEDLFFGFGYAMAQDRLFQLDFFRRKGSGRLAEVLGDGREFDFLLRMVGIPRVLDWDLLARTVGIRRIAEFEWTVLPPETQTLLTAFSNGVNAHIEEVGERLPIEFDLLDYRPEPWSPVDCLTIEVDFRWYLTGRFPVIVIPELTRRVLGDGPLWRAFLQGEHDDESMLRPGEYPTTRAAQKNQPVGVSVGDPDAAQGSNNWVAAGKRTTTGRPLVASDPHVPFDSVSWWYEVHLCGGSFHVAGMAYAGMPAVMFGRNELIAWGCTNNICSQRDLYQEKTDPQHPDCFLYDGNWEAARRREEVIAVKGGPLVRKTIRYSRNGPIVDEVLPPAARQSGPVSLRWLGSYRGGWLSALLAMDRATSAAQFREATRQWHVPTFSVVYADVDGHIGYQLVGRIPVRNVWERGYRPGWDPRHQWDGLIPFEGMPHVEDPPRGWVATANNRPAPDDFPYPLSGTWSDGLRAARIRQMIEARPKLSRDDYVAMQQDALSLRARRTLPHLLPVLSAHSSPRLRAAAKQLQAWDYHLEPDRLGPAIFEVFFSHWTKAVVRARFDGDAVGLLAGGATPLAAALLCEVTLGWFAGSQRNEAIAAAMNTALDYLTERLGSDMTTWTWGRIHTLPLRHVLSGRGDLGQLLDQGGIPVKGDMSTVCNTGVGGQFEGRSGANYRLIAELGTTPPTLFAIDGQSQSGHPGSPHYRDQLTPWVAGRYHELRLERGSGAGWTKLVLEPTTQQ